MSEQPQEQRIDVNRLFLALVKSRGPFTFGVEELQEAYSSIGESDSLSMMQDGEKNTIEIEYVAEDHFIFGDSELDNE